MVFMLFSCVKEEEPKKVSLKERHEVVSTEEHHEGKSLHIAVGAMITPRAGFAYYKQLLEYIGGELGRKVEFVDRESYAEINELLRSGGLDAAFVCSGPYVDGHDEFGLELLVVPQAYGQTVYHSYIIVPTDSTARTLEDLRGGTFAFTDPQSNSGKLAPTYMLSKMGETPETFFGNYVFTYAHDKSIKAVAMGMADGAAVDSLIWEYANRTDPEYTSRTRVILKSPPYGIPPFVVRPGLDQEVKEGLKRVLLYAHEDERGMRILGGMMVERFVQADDEAYNTVREMKAWVSKHGQG